MDTGRNRGPDEPLEAFGEAFLAASVLLQCEHLGELLGQPVCNVSPVYCCRSILAPGVEEPWQEKHDVDTTGLLELSNGAPSPHIVTIL